MIMVYDHLQKKVVPIEERTDKPIIDRSSMCFDSPFVVCDIEPYEGIGFKGTPTVTSRSHRRDLMREHGVRDLGDAMPGWMKERKYEREHGRTD